MKIRLLTALFLFISLPLMAQNADGADTAAAVADGGQNLFELISQGGWAMWPLGGCSLVMFFLIVYGWMQTVRAKFMPDAILPDVATALQKRDVSSAVQKLQGTNTVLSRALGAALGKARPQRADANKAKVETALVENLEAEENGVGQWVNYLNVVAAVAPMIGLLGTVSGMISAFQTIGQGGMGRPELLAGDIGEALITTATGLVVGIPAMIFYFILRNRLGNMMITTVQAASNLVDDLAEEHE